jgi:hypothetical protein
MLMKVILGYTNTKNGASWTISNYVDDDNPNTARAAADEWNDDYMLILPATTHLVFAKIIVNPLPGALKIHVDFPVTGFNHHTGSVIGGYPVSDNAYLMMRGSASNAGGSAYWKLHGIDKSYADATAADKWNIGTDILALQTSSLAWFTQFRRVATGGPTEEHPRRRAYPAVNPPVAWPVMDAIADMYFTKCGRSFALPGVERR